MKEALKPLVELQNLTKVYQPRPGLLQAKSAAIVAVDDFSLSIYPGETLGVVGESGCGKSTLGKMVVRLLDATAGEVIFDGVPITKKSDKEMIPLRKEMQIVFQDPYSSLNPWMSVKELVAEPLIIHQIVPKDQLDARVQLLLDRVGLGQYDSDRYPHQFSGGQRQRICIARALAVNPKFILCDEPVSALDVSIQSQIINLLMDLQKEFGLTYLFISHSFAVIRNMADRVAVMYLGRLVELSPVEAFFAGALHPYAQALLEAIPVPDPDVKRKPTEHLGEIGKSSAVPTGCSFHPRCPHKQPICQEKAPLLKERGAGHLVACHCVE